MKHGKRKPPRRAVQRGSRGLLHGGGAGGGGGRRFVDRRLLVDLARRELVHDERDRAVAGDVSGGAEGVDHDVGRDHEREHRVVEAQVGLQQAGSRHDGAARHARGRDHHDAQQEDEAEDLTAGDVQAGHVHDGQRVEHDLHHRAGQLDGGA